MVRHIAGPQAQPYDTGGFQGVGDGLGGGPGQTPIQHEGFGFSLLSWLQYL